MTPFPQFTTDGEAREFLAGALKPGTGKPAVLAWFAGFERAEVRRNHEVEIEVRVKDARPAGAPARFKPVAKDGKVTYDTAAPMIDLWVTVRFGDDGRLRSWKFVYATVPR